MSHPSQAQGLGKRPKRASRACDHCRWKRLKCSDEQKDKSCMNCIIYGTTCEYTPPWSPGSGKKKESSSKPAGTRGRKLSNGRKDRESCSPHFLESQSSRASSLADEGFHSPSASTLSNLADTRQSSADYHQKQMPNINKDALDEQLDQYTAFLTSFGANRNSPLEILSEEMGLPTQHVTNALLQAYTQGFQAGNMAAQSKLRTEMTSNPARRNRSNQEVVSSPMDYGEVGMGSLAMDHLGSASPDMTSSNVQSPMAYDMQMPSGLGIESQEYPAPLHTVASINNGSSSNNSSRRIPQQSLGQNHGMAAPRSIPTGVDWEVFADQWGHGPKHPVPENRMPQDRYDSKFSFIMEDGFGRRRRGD